MLKLINHHWQYRWERFYNKNKWHLILDLLFLVLIFTLLALLAGLSIYKPALNLNNSLSSTVANTPIDLNNPPLNIETSLATSSANIEDGVNLKIILTNNNDRALNKLELKFSVLLNDFSINRVELINKTDTDILINDTDLILPDLAANSKREINLKVYFKNKNNDSKEINWSLNDSYSINNQNFTSEINLPIVRIASVLSVEARAYYNSPQGDQLGAGPLPPLVGLPTNYWIFVEAKADGNFSDFVYSARLPKGVEITGNRSVLSGDYNYNKDSRELIWRIPLVEANLSDYRIGFEVQLIPTANQTDKILPLLSSAHYSAQEISGDKIKINEDSVSPDTNLFYDTINKGQGEVSK